MSRPFLCLCERKTTRPVTSSIVGLGFLLFRLDLTWTPIDLFLKIVMLNNEKDCDAGLLWMRQNEYFIINQSN